MATLPRSAGYAMLITRPRAEHGMLVSQVLYRIITFTLVVCETRQMDHN